MKASSFLALSLSCLAFGAGCASADPVAPRQAVRYDDHVQSGRQAPARSIFIEDRVASVCDIPKNASFFAPGSAGVDEVDGEVVRRVADCMKDGALKKANVVVIGYTDPSGQAHFNARLGLERAEAVASALVARGVERERLFIKSYGESRASDEMSEAGWAKDRKVTLRVAEPN